VSEIKLAQLASGRSIILVTSAFCPTVVGHIVSHPVPAFRPPKAPLPVAVCMWAGLSASTPLRLSLTACACTYACACGAQSRLQWYVAGRCPLTLCFGSGCRKTRKMQIFLIFWPLALTAQNFWHLYPSLGRPGTTVQIWRQSFFPFLSYKRTDLHTYTWTETHEQMFGPTHTDSSTCVGADFSLLVWWVGQNYFVSGRVILGQKINYLDPRATLGWVTLSSSCTVQKIQLKSPFRRDVPYSRQWLYWPAGLLFKCDYVRYLAALNRSSVSPSDWLSWLTIQLFVYKLI